MDPRENHQTPHREGRLSRLLFTRSGNRVLLLFPPLLVILGALFLRFGLAVLPPCIFYEATGLHCPGCGGVRATLSLLRGDIVLAIYYNPIVVALYAVLAVWYLFFAWNALFRSNYRPPSLPVWKGLIVLGAVLVFWFVRNLSFYTALFF